jgi:hypothetical protein
MKPVSPVIKGFDEVVYAKNQPEYRPLPAIKCADGTVISRWRLTWRERLRVLFKGNLYLQQLTFNAPLQPQLPSVDEPKLLTVGNGPPAEPPKIPGKCVDPVRPEKPKFPENVTVKGTRKAKKT